MKSPLYNDNVFINCPFDSDYKPLFDAIVFAVHDCGFVARCTLEEGDASQVRIDKIYNIIEDCRYGIHDISRTELDEVSHLPRFNMPLELGIFLGAKRFGVEEQTAKKCLVMDIESYRYQKFISDIAGQDISVHDNSPEEVVKIVRNCLLTASDRQTIPSGGIIWKRYRHFLRDLPQVAQRFQLGMEIQCPICSKRSWYSVKVVDYELQCLRCLSQISFPPDLKKVKWAYRTLGPFSTSNQADGAYTVLLTLRFFSDLLLLGGATTPLMSFTAKKEEMEIEADLALFFIVSGLVNTNPELIFAECKTFNDFQEKDIKRMRDLGETFPNAVLIFATMKEELSNNEKKLLLPMVNNSRKSWMKGNTFNSVLILTGTELFWQSGLSEWRQKMEEKTGVINHPSVLQTELHLLCYLTQQTYLDIDLWDQ